MNLPLPSHWPPAPAARDCDSAPATAPETETGAGGNAARLENLAQVIDAYNRVTEKLQQSHENLQAEVARLRAELASKDAQLQRSRRLSALGEMAAGIAHEIRNPLAAIQLYASMADEDLTEVIRRAGGPAAEDHAHAHGTGHAHADPNPDADPDAQTTADAAAGDGPTASARDSTRKIASAVHGLSAIVNDVLSFARQTPPRPGPLAVAEAIGRAVAAHQPAIDQARVEVVQRVDPDAAEVHADAAQLQQVLLNLLRNAVDAMAGGEEDDAAAGDGDRVCGGDGEIVGDPGSGQGSQPRLRPRPRALTLAARREGEGVILTVADTGPGIDDAAVDRIFNPFFTTRGTGTGLGLAIVHRLVDAHGGAISVHNAPRQGGAVFELFFPDLPEADPQASPQATARAGAAEGDTPAPDFSHHQASHA